jgi:hypothetical protein
MKSTIPTMAIAIIIATAAPMMYMSVGGWAATGWGEAVGDAELTVKADSAFDEP